MHWLKGFGIALGCASVMGALMFGVHLWVQFLLRFELPFWLGSALSTAPAIALGGVMISLALRRAR